MMNSTVAAHGSWNGFAYGLFTNLLSLFVLLMLMALVLFVVWMAKFTKKEQLRNWIIIFFVVGVIGYWLSLFLILRLNPWNNNRPNFGHEQDMIQNDVQSGLESMIDEDSFKEMMDTQDQN